MTEFDTFWKTYPKRVAKGDARKAWMQTENIRPISVPSRSFSRVLPFS